MMWNLLKENRTKQAGQKIVRTWSEIFVSSSLLGMVMIGVMSSRLHSQAITASADGAAISVTASVKRDAPLNDYIIGPEDVLAVNVWKEPEASRTLPVRPDGKISLPLIGDIVASGRTTMQLQSEIKQQLRTYFTSPEVAVLVQEAKSHKFNIVGEVSKPGSYLLSNSMTVLDAIAVAG